MAVRAGPEGLAGAGPEGLAGAGPEGLAGAGREGLDAAAHPSVSAAARVHQEKAGGRVRQTQVPRRRSHTRSTAG